MASQDKATIKIIIDSDVKERAKKVARAHGVSLSYLIGEFLIIKYGGHADQLSRTEPALDQYRIRALEKILAGGNLSEDQKKCALAELDRKRAIYETGRLKRKNII